MTANPVSAGRGRGHGHGTATVAAATGYALPSCLEKTRPSWLGIDLGVQPCEKASPNRLISAAEAVGVSFAIAAFGSVLVESDSIVTVLASNKWYSPSANLAPAVFLATPPSLRRSPPGELADGRAMEAAATKIQAAWTAKCVASDLSGLR